MMLNKKWRVVPSRQGFSFVYVVSTSWGELCVYDCY